MGIAYIAAAFGVVPALLLLFDRLSRVPDKHVAGDDVPFGDLDPSQSSPSVADEAERWLESRR